MGGGKARAVLETSFWTVAFRAQVLPYALLDFDMVVPAAVTRELLFTDRRVPARLYPAAALFTSIHPSLPAPPDPEPAPIPMFWPGEAAAIALAQALPGHVLLINDDRPAACARNLGVPVMTVPESIVRACSGGRVAKHMAHAQLRDCERHGTSPRLVEMARSIIDALP